MSENSGEVSPAAKATPKGWRKLLARLESVEAPFKAFGQLSTAALLVSFLGWLVGSVLQYNAWRGEHDLKRFENDLTQATKTFTDVSDTFSKALNLQQQIVFSYSEAETEANDKTKVDFLWNQARNLQDDYRKARAELRQSIGVIVRRAEIYLDWPSADDKDALRRGALSDPLTIVDVESDGIDCDKLIAPGKDVSKWNKAPVGNKVKAANVDWRSAKHHLIVLYACFNQDHGKTESIRRWALGKAGETAASPSFLPADKDKRADLINTLKMHLDLQVERFDKFMVLAMNQIERFRSKNEPQGYVCRLTSICGET